MNITARKPEKTELFKIIYSVLCLAVIGLELVIDVSGENSAGWVLLTQITTVVLAVMYLMLRRQKTIAEEKILGLWLLWTILSRLILGDLAVGIRGSVLWLTRGLFVFALGSVLDEQGRKTLLKWVTALIGGILFFWSACGLMVVLTDYDYLPLVHKNISMFLEVKNGFHVRHLSFYNLHRNGTAPWFMIGLWLMVYQWMACEKKLWRIPIGISAAMFYLIVVLQHCRSIYVATAGGAAMLALLVLMPEKGQKNALRRWAAACLAAVVCLGIVYKSFSVCDSAVTRVSQTTSRIYAQLRGWEQKEQETKEEKEETTGDSRDLVHDLKTMTGRKSIWRGIYRTRKAEPMLLVTGQQEKEILPYLVKYGDLHYETAHTHNMFMEALTQTGVAGLLLCLAFTVLTVLRMVRMFFRRENRVLCALTVPLAGLLVYGMLEPMLSVNAAFASLCFALMSGVLAGEESRK